MHAADMIGAFVIKIKSTVVFDAVGMDETDIRKKYHPILVFMLGDILQSNKTTTTKTKAFSS